MSPPGLTAAGRLGSLRSRLVWTALWWRYAYTFVWAHGPLCNRFRRNVLRVGHVHLCRSCTLVYLGAILTGALLIGMGIPEAGLLAAFYGPLLPTLVASYPPIYEHLPRPGRDVVRFAAGGLAALAVTFFVTGHFVTGTLNVAMLAVAYGLSLSKYKKWKRRACAGCAELGQPGVCSGYRHHAGRIRAYRTVAEGWLASQNVFQKGATGGFIRQCAARPGCERP